MAAQPTRFLVQHCLRGASMGATIQEIVAESFEAVANAVLTNNGEYSAIEVAGLSLEAYQPDFEDWIAARSLGDLMASCKIRVVWPTSHVQQVPPPPISNAYSTPAPPAQQIAESMPQLDVAPTPVTPAQQFVSSPVTTPTTVTIEMKDILLAIGSLPRTTEPSCSSVLEHLARQRLPSLGAMVEAGLRECGLHAAWDAGHNKRPREDQQPHQMDSELELHQHRRRTDDGARTAVGTLARWSRDGTGKHCGFFQPDGTRDRSDSAFVHIDDNPGLASARTDDRIRCMMVPNVNREGQMRAVNSELIDAPPAPAVSRSEPSDRHVRYGVLQQWHTGKSQGLMCGSIQPDGTSRRSDLNFVHILDNPDLRSARIGDRIRYEVVRDPKGHSGQVKAVRASIV